MVVLALCCQHAGRLVVVLATNTADNRWCAAAHVLPCPPRELLGWLLWQLDQPLWWLDQPLEATGG